MIRLKRAYDEVEKEDGTRILIDRLWPRGISREKLQLDDWFKEIAPSDELRRWFDHDPEKFREFSRRYRRELDDHPETIQELLTNIEEYETVTLIYAAKDRQHNNAVVLKAYLEEKFS